MTYQIIYSSVSAVPMQLEDLEDLLAHARSSNQSRKITGALVYVDGAFLQILEGERDRVASLMDKIGGDIRHETVTILQAGETASPLFPDWHMAYVSATPQQIAEWVGLRRTTQVPELFEDMRQSRQRATQVARSILSLLLDERVSQGRGGD